jgi:hypothetical protein
MSITDFAVATAAASTNAGEQSFDTTRYRRQTGRLAGDSDGMARKFADIGDRPLDIPADTPADKVASKRTAGPASPPGSPQTVAEQRRMLAHQLGTEAAKTLGWNPHDYTQAELRALGGQLIVDHALHGDEASSMRMLVSVAKAAGALDAKAMARGDFDKLAGQASEYLHAEFKDELGLSQATARLAQLSMPSRQALARELLQKIGLNPDRAVRGPVIVTPECLETSFDRGKAADFYFDRDALSARNIQDMSHRELSSAEISAMQAGLPDSLDREFGRRFDAYVQEAADQSTMLIDSWLSWIAKKQGVDLSDARIELTRADLLYYRREVGVLRGSAFIYDGKPMAEFPAIGYLATIHTAGGEYRYFLSTREGSARPLPPGISFQDWMNQNRQAVFGVDPDKKQANRRSVQEPRPRTDRETGNPPPAQDTADLETMLNKLSSTSNVVLSTLGTGQRTPLATWLTPALRDHFGKARETARGQTSQERSVDFLLDFIPFRRMIVAIQKGDVETAMIAGTMDIMLFLVPLLGSTGRTALAAARGMAPMWRLVGEGFAKRGIPGVRAVLLGLPELRASIKTAMSSMNATSMATGSLRPLDAEGMAAALRPRFPALAQALRQSVARERGPAVVDGWWRVPAERTATAEDAAIETLRDIRATDRDGNRLPLRPYGNDSGAAYTQIDLATQQRTGAILLADRDGWLYRSLPADTLEGYRVRAPEDLRALSSQRPAADGTLAWQGKTYARILDDHIEIAAEHGSTADRPVWRVVAPPDARRGIVTHRLFYDTDRALWRQADLPELKGGSGGRRLSPNRPRDATAQAPHGSAPRGNAFHDVLLSGIRGAPTARETQAVRDLLTRLENHPRAAAILRAMRAYHELRGEAPEIVLLEKADLARPRPMLDAPVRGTAWHLDLNALHAESTEAAASEVAAVYNNMTGILQGEEPFADILARGEPRLDAGLEKSWRQWIYNESWRAQRTQPLSMARENLAQLRHESLVENLRSQLQQARCHGGLDRASFMEVLENHFEGEIPGLRLDLHEENFVLSETGVLAGADNRIITTLPPLPDGIHGLDVSGRAIKDWSNLPANLKVLVASNTGGGEVLKHLPAGLVDLDVSANGLSELPFNLPDKLKRLNASGNRLPALPRLPDTLQELSVHENRLEHLPENLPSSLRIMRAQGNRLGGLPARLPSKLEILDLSDNQLRDLPDMSGLVGLEWLDLHRNSLLTALPRLPNTLETLYATDCSLAELPGDLPESLTELYVGYNRLTRLPDLPPRLYVLGVNNNLLEQLPASINELGFCEIYLEGNPIVPEGIPRPPAGMPGPHIHFSMAGTAPTSVASSPTLAQAARQWLDTNAVEAAARWDAIGAAADARETAAFRAFLDHLRETASYKNADFRASIQEWLVDLSTPERKSLLESTLQMCVGATEQCEDRVALTLNGLRKLRLHDDIRLGRYNDRPTQALDAMRQLFRLRALEDIAHRKIATMEVVDDVEVYLAYAVKLREKLGLSTVVPEMRFFGVAGVTQEDLDIALLQVQEAERKDFYKDLVIDDTWNAFIKQQLGVRHERAMETLGEMANAPLRDRIQAKLIKRGLNPEDADAQRNMGPVVWRDMRYEVLEPLTRDYLASAGLPLP